MCDACIAACCGSTSCGGGCSTLICTCISWRTTSMRSLLSSASNSVEGLALVFVQRIALAVAAQADILAQMVEMDDVLAPVVIERLQQDRLLDIAHDVGAEIRGALGGARLDRLQDALAHFFVGDAFFLRPVDDRQVEAEDLVDFVVQARRVPLFGIGLLGNVARDEFLDDFLAHLGDLVADIVRRHDLLALLEDHLALVVEHVVVFQDVLAHLEVARFDLLLRLLERLVHPGMGDRLALFEAEPRAGSNPCAPSRRCASDRPAGSGRTSRRRDRPGGPNGRAAGCRCAGFRGVRCRRRRGRRPRAPFPCRRRSRPGSASMRRARSASSTIAAKFVAHAHVDIAAELDVGAAAGHVGGDGHGAGDAGLRDDRGFLFVIARVQHVVRDLALLQQARRAVPTSRSRSCRPAPAGRASWHSSISLMIASFFSSAVR